MTAVGLGSVGCDRRLLSRFLISNLLPQFSGKKHHRCVLFFNQNLSLTCFIVTRYLAATATRRSRCHSSSGTYRRPRMVGEGNSRCYWSSRSVQPSVVFYGTHIVLLRFRIHFQFVITRFKRTSISFRHNILNSHQIQGNDYSSSLVSQPQTFREFPALSLFIRFLFSSIYASLNSWSAIDRRILVSTSPLLNEFLTLPPADCQS